MSVRKIRDGWYVDIQYDGRRIRKKSPDNTQAGARVYEAHIRLQLARGVDPTQAIAIERTFAQLSQEWMRTHVTQATHSWKGIETKRRVLDNHLLPEFGRRFVRDITTRHVDVYITKKEREGYAAKTINNQTAILRTILRVGMDWDYLKRLPVVRKLPAQARAMQFFNESDVAKLLADEDEPVYASMVRTGLRTGMRIGELLGLEWDCVNFDDGVIHVRRNRVRGHVGRPKSKKYRDIPMSADLAQVLEQARRSAGPVFTREKGRFLTDSMCEKAMKRLCKRAGVHYLGWHALRHTFGTQLVRRGVDIHAICRLMGHSSITVTEKYLHVLASTLKGSVDALTEPALTAPRQHRVNDGKWNVQTNKTSEPNERLSIDRWPLLSQQGEFNEVR